MSQVNIALAVDPLLLPPRRETSRRKAKEKTSVKQFLDRQQGIDYFDNDEEQGDSDSDPAWTPAVKLVGDEEEKKKKRGRPVITKKSRKALEEDDYSPCDVVSKKSARKKHETPSKTSNVTGKLSCKIDEKLLASVSDEDIDISPFKVPVQFLCYSCKPCVLTGPRIRTCINVSIFTCCMQRSMDNSEDAVNFLRM